MTNQGVHTVAKNIRQKSQKSQQMRVERNKRYYEKLKTENPDKSKEQALNWYRNKYGEGLVRDYVSRLGVPMAMEALKNLKREIKDFKNENVLFQITL
jgi:ribosomal protein S21